ncbi:hypothetical protein ACFSCU_15025 [Ottowia beijingensis]
METHQPHLEGNPLPSPQPETASFPMRTQADHDAFVTLPESPAGRLQAETPGFLVSGCSSGCRLRFVALSSPPRRPR